MASRALRKQPSTPRWDEYILSFRIARSVTGITTYQ